MKYRLLTTSLIALSACLSGVIAQDKPAEATEDESKQVFESLFGEKISAARASFVKTDDVQLAGELLAAAIRAVDIGDLLEAFRSLSRRQLVVRSAGQTLPWNQASPLKYKVAS